MPVSFEYASASCWNGLSVAPLALPNVKVKLSAALPEPLEPPSSPPPPQAVSARAPTADTATNEPRRRNRPEPSWVMVQPFELSGDGAGWGRLGRGSGAVT